MNDRPPLFRVMTLGFGYAFLYAPIVSVVIYSFNASRLVTIWGGFSTRWYVALVNNQAILGAAWLSLKVAFLSASLALVVGTLAGFVLARFGKFGGRTLFSGMVTAPLVVPEVIGAISTLLLFVDLKDLIGWPSERGLWALAVAHAAYTLSYVAVVVQSRLADMDRSVEEAAMDLGARPWKVFCVITLPIISPALLSGWLLAFSLSLDDVVTSAFVAGPGATTLPLLVFSSVKLGVDPQVNAIGTIIVAVVGTATVVSGIWVTRRERARLRSVNLLRDEALLETAAIAA